jgi:hypothetical protein
MSDVADKFAAVILVIAILTLLVESFYREEE